MNETRNKNNLDLSELIT